MKQFELTEAPCSGRRRRQKRQHAPSSGYEHRHHMDQLVLKLAKSAQAQKQLENVDPNCYYEMPLVCTSPEREAMCDFDSDSIVTCEEEIDILLHDPIYPADACAASVHDTSVVRSKKHISDPVHQYHYSGSTYSQTAWPGRRSDLRNPQSKLECVARNMNEIINDLNSAEQKTPSKMRLKSRRTRSWDDKLAKHHQRHKHSHYKREYPTYVQQRGNHVTTHHQCSPLPFESAYHSSTLGRTQRKKAPNAKDSGINRDNINDNSNNTCHAPEHGYYPRYKYYSGRRYELLPSDDHFYETIPGGDHCYQLPITASNRHLIPPPLPPRPEFLVRSDPNLLGHEYLELLPDSDDEVFEPTVARDDEVPLVTLNNTPYFRDAAESIINRIRNHSNGGCEPEYMTYGSRGRRSTTGGHYDGQTSGPAEMNNRWMSPSPRRVDPIPAKLRSDEVDTQGGTNNSHRKPDKKSNNKTTNTSAASQRGVNDKTVSKSRSERDLSKLRVSVYHHYTVDDVLESIQRVEVGDDLELFNDKKSRRRSNKKLLPRLHGIIHTGHHKETFF